MRRTTYPPVVLHGRGWVMSSKQPFSVHNILGKPPHDIKLEDVYTIDKQLGKLAASQMWRQCAKGNGRMSALRCISSPVTCRQRRFRSCEASYFQENRCQGCRQVDIQSEARVQRGRERRPSRGCHHEPGGWASSRSITQGMYVRMHI